MWVYSFVLFVFLFSASDYEINEMGQIQEGNWTEADGSCMG